MRDKKPTPLLQKIFELRREKGITLAKLGKALGNISESGASSIENGDVPLKAEHLPAIAKLLKVATWELFTEYEKGEIGPLNSKEKKLILRYRAARSEKQRQTILDIAEGFSND